MYLTWLRTSKTVNIRRYAKYSSDPIAEQWSRADNQHWGRPLDVCLVSGLLGNLEVNESG